jgi:hypothetical protein
MEALMTQHIRRRSDGSIDFFRTRASAQRGQARRDDAALRAVAALVMAGAIGFALLLPSGSNRDHDRIAAPGDHSSQTR